MRQRIVSWKSWVAVSLLGSLVSLPAAAAELRGTKGEAGCVQFRGLTHCPLGSAELSLSGEGMRVSNIGQSGDDGVVVYLPNVRFWHAEMPESVMAHSAPAGAFVESTVIGQSAGIPEQVILRHREESSGAGWRFSADFSDPSNTLSGVASCGAAVVAFDRSDDPGVDPRLTYFVEPEQKAFGRHLSKASKAATGWWRLVLDGEYSYWECGGT